MSSFLLTCGLALPAFAAQIGFDTSLPGKEEPSARLMRAHQADINEKRAGAGLATASLSPPEDANSRALLSDCTSRGCACSVGGGGMTLLGPGRTGVGPPESDDTEMDIGSLTSFWSLKAPLQGKTVPMDRFGRPKAMLVANIASGWGYANPFYGFANRMLAKLPRTDFNIIAFPVNDFGSQAPGCSECERAYMYKKMGLPYGAFPIFDKVAAVGDRASAVYRFLTDKHQPDIKWNYEFFLVDSLGEVKGRYRTADLQQGKGSFDEVEKFINTLLA